MVDAVPWDGNVIDKIVILSPSISLSFRRTFIWLFDESSIIVSEDIIYSATTSGMIYAIDASDGKLIWDSEIDEKYATPNVSNDMVFVSTNIGLYAIDKKEGRVIKQEELQKTVMNEY